MLYLKIRITSYESPIFIVVAIIRFVTWSIINIAIATIKDMVIYISFHSRASIHTLHFDNTLHYSLLLYIKLQLQIDDDISNCSSLCVFTLIFLRMNIIKFIYLIFVNCALSNFIWFTIIHIKTVNEPS